MKLGPQGFSKWELESLLWHRRTAFRLVLNVSVSTFGDKPFHFTLGSLENHAPAPAIRKVRVPVLLLFGNQDVILPVRRAISEWEADFRKAGNRDYAIKTLADVGHPVFLRREDGKTVILNEGFNIIEKWLANHRFSRSTQRS